MKSLIALVLLTFASLSFAAESAKKEEVKPPVKAEANCVTKDKKGNCPPAPKSDKPTPKKVEKKAEAPKVAASAPKAEAKK